MRKKLINIYLIGCVLFSVSLLFYSDGYVMGSYFLFGYIISICTIILFNTIFFYLLHKLKLLNLQKISYNGILLLSIVTLIIPSLIYTLLCKYCYEYVFVDDVCSSGVIRHSRIIWLNPLCIHMYCYLLVIILFICIKLKNIRRG